MQRLEDVGELTSRLEEAFREELQATSAELIKCVRGETSKLRDESTEGFAELHRTLKTLLEASGDRHVIGHCSRQSPRLSSKERPISPAPPSPKPDGRQIRRSSTSSFGSLGSANTNSVNTKSEYSWNPPEPPGTCASLREEFLSTRLASGNAHGDQAPAALSEVEQELPEPHSACSRQPAALSSKPPSDCNSDGYAEAKVAGLNVPLQPGHNRRPSLRSVASMEEMGNFSVINESKVKKGAQHIKSVRRASNASMSRAPGPAHDEVDAQTATRKSCTSSTCSLKPRAVVNEGSAWVERSALVWHTDPAVAARAAVLNGTFDFMVCLGLIANAIFIGVQVDLDAKEAQEPAIFRGLEVCFCVFFAVELMLRLYVFRKSFFIPVDWWNLFDFSLVALQVLDEILTVSVGKDTALGKGSVGRVVRILRMLRILRLLRVIRFVTELRKVIYLLIGSLGSFFWTLTLLILLIYIFGVFFTQIVADHRMEQTQVKADMDAKLDESFGSTIGSIHTLYKAITGGFDWEDVSTPLINKIDPFVGLVFALYTAFASLVLLNLVTGVFVDGALKLSKADKEIELTAKAYRVFESTDTDKSGTITWEEFSAQLGSDRMCDFFETLEISMSRAEDLFGLLDTSQHGELSVEELVAGGMMLQGPAKSIDVATLAKHMQASVVSINDSIDQLARVLESPRSPTLPPLTLEP